MTKYHVTPDLIESKIKSETYTRLPSGKTTVCELVLENGYSVIGTSSMVDPDGYNELVAKLRSKDDAVKKIWELEGYLLQQSIYGAKNR